jgi:hypothetical protein
MMLGGAALKSGQCNPPAIICLCRRNKVQRPEATEAALLVGLPELLLKFRDPTLSQDGNSFIVSWTEQNIRLHTHPGLDQSLEAGDRRIEVLHGWPQGANARGISCATVGLCSEARAEALTGQNIPMR